MPQACNKDVPGNPEAQAGQMVVHGRIVSRWRRHTHERGPLLEVIEIAVAKAGARSRPMASNHA